ncbi:MAG TPA: ABC transporter substrate-binding protein [Candidatus Limnocylindria bacterium]|nr:ABC transporter substrate-binding protein [Candidatus Limnocylindria bacterium]
MRRVNRASGLAVVVVLGIILAACGGQTTTSVAPSGSPGASAPSTATGGTVRIGIGGSADSLNPGNGLLSEAYDLYELVYDTPIGMNQQGEFIPELATEWSVAEDGVTWTMTIRDDAVFHDGEPVTAEDVAFSIQLYKDTQDFPYLPSYASYFETIEAPDDTTVVLTTAEPIGNFEANIVFMYVLPKHIWEDVEDPIEFQNEEMIGSGPFALGEFRRREFARLEANADYWNGAPFVDEVIFQTIRNADARIQALINGEVDAVAEVPPTAVPSLRNAENVHLHVADVAAGGSIRDILFNMVAPEDCPREEGGECTGHPALQEVEVRRALAMAVDKQQLIDVALLGLGSQGVGFVPPGLGDYFIGTEADIPYDAAGANALLDQAGYTDTDGDGIRECKAGQDCPTGDLTLRFHYADDIDTAPREAELLQDMWAAIGVRIEIQGLDPDTLTSICCPTFGYDIILWGWGSDPDPGFLLGVTTCAEIPTGYSETGYCNEEYDQLYEEQGTETDREARIAIVHQMQQMLLDDVPYIVPFYEQTVEAWRTDTFSGWLDDNPTFGLAAPENLTVLRPLE